MEEEKKEAEKKDYLITIDGKNKRREIRLSAFEFNFGIFLIMFCAFIFIGTCSYSVYGILHHQQNLEFISEVQRAGEMQQEQLLAVSKKAANLSETIQNLAQQEEELRIQAGLNKPAREDKVPEENQSAWVPPGDETSELEEIAPIEGLPTPEELSARENVPANVEISQQEIKSAWTPPAPLENVQTPAPVQNSVPEIKSEWKPPTAEGAYTGQGGPLPDLGINDVSEALQMVEKRVAIRLDSINDFQAELKARREQMAVVAAIPATNTSGGYSSVVVNNSGTPDLNIDFGQFGGSSSGNTAVPSIWPTNGVVTSPYGLRWGGTDFHPGIDIANDLGTPIVATADGIVEYAGWNAGGYGNMVDINHGNGIMTRYGHASQVVVSNGQYVKRGQLIAYMGSTGFSTGPHVHYEVHVNGQRVNPISYL